MAIDPKRISLVVAKPKPHLAARFVFPSAGKAFFCNTHAVRVESQVTRLTRVPVVFYISSPETLNVTLHVFLSSVTYDNSEYDRKNTHLLLSYRISASLNPCSALR